MIFHLLLYFYLHLSAFASFSPFLTGPQVSSSSMAKSFDNCCAASSALGSFTDFYLEGAFISMAEVFFFLSGGFKVGLESHWSASNATGPTTRMRTSRNSKAFAVLLASDELNIYPGYHVVADGFRRRPPQPNGES
jgi:hypothetical protein